MADPTMLANLAPFFAGGSAGSAATGAAQAVTATATQSWQDQLPGILSAAQGFGSAASGLAAYGQANRNAALLKRLGLLNADEDRRIGRALRGTQITAAAENGADPSSGSALDIQLASSAEIELQALMTAFGFTSQASVEKVQGRNMLVSGVTRGIMESVGGDRQPYWPMRGNGGVILGRPSQSTGYGD